MSGTGKEGGPHFTWKESIAIGELIEKTRKEWGNPLCIRLTHKFRKGRLSMKEILLMAVDLGTSFIKAGVYNTESQCIAIEMEPVKDYRPKPGVLFRKEKNFLHR